MTYLIFGGVLPMVGTNERSFIWELATITVWEQPKILKKLISGFLKPLSKGTWKANTTLAFSIYHGEVVKHDYKKAVHWYSLAAMQGYREAQRDLGVCYIDSTGVKADYEKAVYWYKKAAAKNDPKTLYNLGLFYKNGTGVAPSNRWAIHYFKKAKEFGFKKATEQLQALK